MPAFSKPLKKSLYKKLLKLGTPDGGKADLATKTGFPCSTISRILETGKALPATIEKLEEVFPSKSKKAQAAA